MNRTWTLAIETSGRVGSIAVGCENDILGVEQFSADLRHAVELLPTIDRLCRLHDCPPDQLRLICVSIGPGSFTGLRIGVTVARTLAWAGNAKVVAVPTLQVIAQNALETRPAPSHLGVVLDAKRGKVFAAPFELRGDRYLALAEPAEHDPTAFARSLPAESMLIGEGLAYHRSTLGSAGFPWLPDSLNRARSETVYRLGLHHAEAQRWTDPAALTPIYIRRPEAEEKWEARHRSGT